MALSGARACQPYLPLSQAKRWQPFSCVQLLCGLPASFLGVSFYLMTTDPLVSRAIDALYGKELQRLGAVDNTVFED